MDPTYFVRSFQYDAWANRRTLHALRQIPDLDDRSRQVMAHLLSSQKVWLTRLRGQDTATLTIWPPLTLDACESLLEENAQACQQFLGSLRPERLTEIITHRTSTGLELRVAVADILTQILLHGSYHRGQLAAAIKRRGNDPPMTDYIIFTRET